VADAWVDVINVAARGGGGGQLILVGTWGTRVVVAPVSLAVVTFDALADDDDGATVDGPFFLTCWEVESSSESKAGLEERSASTFWCPPAVFPGIVESPRT